MIYNENEAYSEIVAIAEFMYDDEYRGNLDYIGWADKIGKATDDIMFNYYDVDNEYTDNHIDHIVTEVEGYLKEA